MLKKREFLKEILTIANGELLALGFREEKSGYSYPIVHDVQGWLGLGTTLNEGPRRVGVYPVVGVTFEALEKRVRDLCGRNDARPTGTLSTQLGYVMPQKKFLPWIFEPSPFDWTLEARRMVEAVEAFGIPFMEANTKLETIIDHLEHHRYIDRDSAAYRLPIAYRIAGRSALAIDFVNNYLAEIGSRTDEAAHRYRTFAAHFMQQAVF